MAEKKNQDAATEVRPVAIRFMKIHPKFPHNIEQYGDEFILTTTGKAEFEKGMYLNTCNFGIDYDQCRVVRVIEVKKANGKTKMKVEPQSKKKLIDMGLITSTSNGPNAPPSIYYNTNC